MLTFSAIIHYYYGAVTSELKRCSIRMILDLLTKLYLTCYKKVALLLHMLLMKLATVYNMCVIGWADLLNTVTQKKYMKVCTNLNRTHERTDLNQWFVAS